MYECFNCGRTFAEPVTYKENYGLPGPWHQTFEACPHCGVDHEFSEVEEDEELAVSA